MARIVAIVVLAALAATPAAALAKGGPPEPQQSPFQQAPAQSQNQVGEQPEPTPAPAPTTQTTVDDGSLSARETLLIGLGIAALIGGIWFVISRDARRATGGRVRAAGAPSDGRGGSATRAAHRSRKLSAEERRRRKRGRAR